MSETDLNPADLRGILRYVPQWRDHIFVIAIDAGVVIHENFNNVLQDIAVLWNLNIKVVLVFGLGHSLVLEAQRRGVKVTDHRGEGPTDEATLELGVEVAGKIAHEIMQGMTHNGIRCVLTNAIRAAEFGVINGVDQMRRGKVEKIDLSLLQQLLENKIIPILAPIAFSREGTSLRLNSDQLASNVAVSLKASKLIYLAPHPGLTINGQMVLNMTVDELRGQLKEYGKTVDPDIRGKADFAIETIEGGTPRVHIIDGRERDTLLTEIFNNVGVGSMIYGNDYAQIRQARKRDAQAIYNITQQAVRTQSLRRRTRQEVISEIEHFYIYEIDQSIIGCLSLRPYSGTDIVELEAVYVQPFYQGRGVGRKLVEFALMEAGRKGKKRVIALSTQSYTFFRTVCGFSEGGPEDLPDERLQELKKSRRNSKILIKDLEK